MNVYLRMAFRNLWKNRGQLFVAMLGLAFGLVCTVFALYWLRYEVSYDSFYPDSKQIYRVYAFDRQSGKVDELVSGVLERKLDERFPALQHATLFFQENCDCRTERAPYTSLRLLFTDSTFWQVFPQPVIAGELVQPLQMVNDIVLSESSAIRLFGSPELAVGKSVQNTTLDDSPYRVTAVVRDPSPHSNLQFDALLSHEQIRLQKEFPDESQQAVWGFAALQMYVKLPPHTDEDRLVQQLKDYPRLTYHVEKEVCLLPIGDVRHQLNRDAPFSLNFIYLFVLVGILLLGSALFNLLNLYFDFLRQRMREFRLRVVNGASGKQLVEQMMTELICVFACTLLIAVLLVVLAFPLFSNLLRIPLEGSLLVGVFVICGTLSLFVVLLASCIYFVRLSRSAISFQIETNAGAAFRWQRMAIMLQLAVSVLFIAATSVMMMQMNFVSHKDLGFKKEGLLYLSGVPPFISEHVYASLKERLSSMPQILSMTDVGFTPQHAANPFKMTTYVSWSGKQPQESPAFNFISSDSFFQETFGVQLVEGKWLREGGVTDLVLNEEAVRVMGLKSPVGSIVRIKLNEERDYRVVGVVKDFHTLSLRSPILPTLFVPMEYPENNFYLRVFPGKEQDVIQSVNALLPKIDVTLTNAYLVKLDQLYDRLNYSEQAGMKLFFVLALVCLLICLLGIYAVIVAAAFRRRKEIAIRKVVGAESRTIVFLFLREYVCYVFFASLFALPIAYKLMDYWLQSYTYRIAIPYSLWISVLVGVIVLVLFTILGQVLRAANRNPAEVVKSE